MFSWINGIILRKRGHMNCFDTFKAMIIWHALKIVVPFIFLSLHFICLIGEIIIAIIFWKISLGWIY